MHRITFCSRILNQLKAMQSKVRNIQSYYTFIILIVDRDLSIFSREQILNIAKPLVKIPLK